MPKGQNPTSLMSQRVATMEKQVQRAQSHTLLQKIAQKLNMQERGGQMSAYEKKRVKTLRNKIAKRQESLLKNGARADRDEP
jgi:anti-sigma28 factor (negative regulator of flagellin synthesis)